ncbi:MAG TPA: DUF5709 domain-containing protein [Trebonia sp.]
MADPRKHESEDLEDYTVLDGTDTLDGNPGDDPLDRGVATPDRWSAGVQYALKGEEQSESLDELLAEEEPDETADADDEDSLDENATYRDVERFERDDEPDARAGRLVAPDEDTDDVSDTLVDWEDDEVARDTGIGGGGATAEEAAVHVIDDPDDDDNDEDDDLDEE